MVPLPKPQNGFQLIVHLGCPILRCGLLRCRARTHWFGHSGRAVGLPRRCQASRYWAQGVLAAESGGREEKASAARDHADGQDVPDVFGNQIGDYEIQFGFLVGDGAAVGDALDAELVASVAHASAGFYLDAPDSVSAFEHEVVAMHLPVGLGDDVAEAHGLVDEGDFAEVAAAGDGQAAGAGGLLGAALLGRRRASGWSGLVLGIDFGRMRDWQKKRRKLESLRLISSLL